MSDGNTKFSCNINVVLDVEENICAYTLFKQAIKTHSLNKIIELVTKYSPNVKHSCGMSALHYCCGYENESFAKEVLKCFINNGGNINDRMPCEKWTPLHIASMNDKIEIAKILLKHGALVDIKDADGNAAIDYAIENECAGMIELLSGETKRENTLFQPVQMNNMGTKRKYDTGLDVSNIIEHKLRQRPLTPRKN